MRPLPTRSRSQAERVGSQELSANDHPLGLVKANAPDGVWSAREPCWSFVAFSLGRPHRGGGRHPSSPFPPSRCGDFRPGSKSFTNRALLIAALARGRSVLTGVLRSDDSFWLSTPCGGSGSPSPSTATRLPSTAAAACGPRPAASSFRFGRHVGPLSSRGPRGRAKCGWLVDGSDQLRGRPVAPLLKALRELGADIRPLNDDDSLPFEVRAGGLKGGTVSISGKVSSQFISGLLIAAPYASEPVTIKLIDDLVQPAYIGITIALMREFGADVQHEAGYREIHVKPGAYQGKTYTLEADASSACYLLALPAVAPGRVQVTNVGTVSLQPDAAFVDVLEAMGLIVHRSAHSLATESPPQGAGRLVGDHTFDMKPMSDQALTVGALAPFASGPITVTNVGHIRKHESDRIAALRQNLARMGVRVDEREDAFTVYPKAPQAAAIDPYDDHRNAMAFTLIGARVPGVKILDPGCVSKTFPTFFDVMQQVGVGVTFHWK